jgi:hypothetical protein
MEESDVVLEFNDGFEDKMGVAIEVALTASANDLGEIVRGELPRSDKSGKHAQDSVVVYPAKEVGGIIEARVEIGKGLNYIWALWKGIPRGSQTIPYNGNAFKFPKERWTTVTNYKPDKNGWFTLKQDIKRYMPENKFIERSLDKFSKMFIANFTVKFNSIVK